MSTITQFIVNVWLLFTNNVFFLWLLIIAVLCLLFNNLEKKRAVSSILLNRNNWEEWLRAGISFEAYKDQHPNAMKDGSVSCIHCYGRKINMIVQGRANESAAFHHGCFILPSYDYGPLWCYRSHVCGTCGKELYRTKGV